MSHLWIPVVVASRLSRGSREVVMADYKKTGEKINKKIKLTKKKSNMNERQLRPRPVGSMSVLDALELKG